MNTRKICVVTGFEPFSDWKVNPSAEIVKKLDGMLVNGFQIKGRVLPVKFNDLRREIESIMQELRPHLLIMLGLAPTPVIRLEKVATNWIHARIKYNDGSKPQDQFIIPDAPAAYFTDVSVADLEAMLRQNGIPCHVSPSAGSFACNQSYFLALHARASLSLSTRVLFIHVPPIPEEVARRGKIEPSMPLELSTKAVNLIIRSLLLN